MTPSEYSSAKRRNESPRLFYLIIPLIGLLALLAVFGRIALHSNFSVHAQQSEPEPSPTPVNQHWRIEYGSIEELQDKLKALNNENIEVTSEELDISLDGKRFVIKLHDPEPCEDCDE